MSGNRACGECISDEQLERIRPFSTRQIAVVGILLTAYVALGIHVVRILFHSGHHASAWILAAVMTVPLGQVVNLFGMNNIVGRELWVFLDKTGNVHKHLDAGDASPAGYQNWTEFYRAGHAMFRARVGGGIRDTKIVVGDGRGYTNWELSSWNGEDIALHDTSGNILHFQHVRTNQLLEIVGRFNDVSDILSTFAKMEQTMGQSHAERRLELIQEKFDDLGLAVTLLIYYMEQSKETMGRSKHAQVMREFLEQILKELKVVEVEKWSKRAAGPSDLKAKLESVAARVLKRPAAEVTPSA